MTCWPLVLPNVFSIPSASWQTQKAAGACAVNTSTSNAPLFWRQSPDKLASETTFWSNSKWLKECNQLDNPSWKNMRRQLRLFGVHLRNENGGFEVRNCRVKFQHEGRMHISWHVKSQQNVGNVWCVCNVSSIKLNQIYHSPINIEPNQPPIWGKLPSKPLFAGPISSWENSNG